MLYAFGASSAVLLEEFVSLIIVMGKSDVGTCPCKVKITGIAKRIEAVKTVEIKNTCSLFISLLHLYQSI